MWPNTSLQKKPSNIAVYIYSSREVPGKYDSKSNEQYAKNR